ncbi:MAG: hypothetical protein GDA37_09615, partial [Ekhidna sp.]|nr:hypothetical protein [Ekhidna sp.]
YTLAVKVSDGKLSGTANITINVEPPAADFTVSSTNTTINIDGSANVYTVDVETTLTNWTITSSDGLIIPKSEIQKMGDSRFQMAVAAYYSGGGSSSRPIELTLSGTGGNLVITVNQTKSTMRVRVDSSVVDLAGGPFVILSDGTSVTLFYFARPSATYSDEVAITGINYTVGDTSHDFTVSVSPSESIRLRNMNPQVGNDIFFHLTPPSGSANDYAIITLTSTTDPTKKTNLVIVLRPPSDS